MLKLVVGTSIVALACAAQAEQYVISTKFNRLQPAQYRVTLNGRTLLLHRNADGSADITPWVTKGKNTLKVEVLPGQNRSRFSESVLTLGARNGERWRTLYKKAVTRDTRPGTATFVFVGDPSGSAEPGQVVLSGKFNRLQPVGFEIDLNGETVSTMDSDGNVDLTPFLNPGKNVVTVRYAPGENKSSFSQSNLTIGQQVGGTWVSLLKWGVGAWDTRGGSTTFPIYR